MLTLAFIGLSTANAQVGVGTNTPDASAALEVQSTTQGFLPPRLTTVQRDGISNPAEGLIVYNTGKKCLQFFDGSFWFDACEGIADVPTVIGANEKEWMDRNLGASQIATASDDFLSYGGLYQWGRRTDGHEIVGWTSSTTGTLGGLTSTLSSTDTPLHSDFITTSSAPNDWRSPQNTTLWQGTNSVNNPCPRGYRLPTSVEFNEERLSWSNQNLANAFDSPLKLSMPGHRFNANGFLQGVGTSSRYWTSTVSGTGSNFLSINSSSAAIFPGNRADAYAVRCIKD